MKSLFVTLERVADSTQPVLLFGESGTGKELAARVIHDLSRQENGFFGLNCAALSKDLIEAELFGHAAGSFTGALRSKEGLFEAMSNGTLLLDEISEMPLSSQTRLLRVLEEKKIRRIGETRERKANPRIIAATNQNLKKLVGLGRFREDLYYRLNVLRVDIPPLRERRSDIPLLCRHFFDQAHRETGKRKTLSEQALQQIQSYPFPGNVRELKNLLFRLVICSEKTFLQVSDLPIVDLELERREPGRNPLTEKILAQLLRKEGDFWSLARRPYIRHELAKRDLYYLVRKGLEMTDGSFRGLLELFNLPAEDYKRFLSFLQHHGIKPDYRLYRKQGL